MRLLAIFTTALYDCCSHTRGYCDYCPLSVCEVMSVLNYYLNLYVGLNNAVITICKLK
jgi:hypothetical protein